MNGYVSQIRNKNYWYDFSRSPVTARLFPDAAIGHQWKATRSLSGYQKRVWLSDGTGRIYVNVATAVGVNDIFDGRSVALVDLWNREVLV